MNIYQILNRITLYIEQHLDMDIDYGILAKIMGVNVYTMQKIFSCMTGIPLSEYIRKRRLSVAGYDLYHDKSKVMELAIKYQYQNATSFSRAFEGFHGIKPSLVTKETKLRNYPRITFREDIPFVNELEYEIITLDEIKLYGVGIDTNNETIEKDAPDFFEKTEAKYLKQIGNVLYGMITYDNEQRLNCLKYYCLYDQKLNEFETIFIPASKWLKFRIPNQLAEDIRKVSQLFYKQFLPSCKYNLKKIPELEYYHDGVTDFLVAIY